MTPEHDVSNQRLAAALGRGREGFEGVLTSLGDRLMPPVPADLRPAFKDVDSWWTVLVVDPVAARLLPALLPRSWVTPNRITALSGVLGLASGAAFLVDRPRTAAVLFEGRFLLDCLDGKVARMRGVKSEYGHFLDVVTDFAGTTWTTAAFGMWLARSGRLPPHAALAPLAAKVVWAWTQSERYSVAPPAILSAGDPAQAPASKQSPWSGIEAALHRRRMTRLPSSIEAETLALFVGPLTGSPRAAQVMWMLAAGGFFAPSTVQNVVRTARAVRSRDRDHDSSSRRPDAEVT